MDPKLINVLTFSAAALTVVGVFSIISDLVLREKARSATGSAASSASTPTDTRANPIF